MVETLRLGWNENLPLSQLAWGNITASSQITAVLPLLTANYDLSNDVRYTAQKRGSILLNAMLEGVEQGVNTTADKMPDTRWLLLVAHDTNIAMVRTLMDFSWTLSGYTRGNIPPGSSLVFERWRDSQSGQRFLRIYFQGQSLDDLRNLQAVNQAHPLLREEWRQSDCRITDVGTLCPMKSAVKALSKNLDKHSITAVIYD
jgi:4-phytase/acid phosphatase